MAIIEAPATEFDLAGPSGARRLRSRRGVPLIAWLLIAVSLFLAGGILFADVSRLSAGLMALGFMLCLLGLGIPIGFAMIGASVIGLLGMMGAPAASSSAEAVVHDAVASWELSVIPLFVLMGIALWRGGVTAKAYEAAHKWLGRLPGGLAVATTFAGAGLASTSGSTMGITLALGRMSIPEMLRHGYRPSLATGSVAMAGTLGQVIPPSILLVVYAGVAQVPVGPQLLAGVVPGFLLAAGFCLAIVVWALVSKTVAPRSVERVSWSERFASLIGIVPLVVIALIVLGGMGTGFFTATEAAAAGAAAALLVGWILLGRGKRGPRSAWAFLRLSVLSAIASVGGLFLIVIGAGMLTRVMALSGVADLVTQWLLGLNLSRVGLLLLLIVVYVVMGMFLESLPMIILTVPLLQAPLEALGVDMIWFGVFIIIMCEIGMVFPPIGLLTFVVHRLAQDPNVNLGQTVTLSQVFKGIMPFVAVALVVAVLLIVFPDIPLWLSTAS